MCGICGYAGPKVGKTTDDHEIMTRMLNTLRLRGPDDEGRFIDSGIALGMRRLAVIDIQGGHQPFIDTNTGVVLVYNGELYNFQALKEKLIHHGHTFRSNSDTEVILKAYLEYDRGFIHHLNGMFALSIWDPRNDYLILARDHFGQKPLYIYNNEDTIIFGSDLRTLLAHPKIDFNINQNSLTHYLQYRHIPSSASIIQNVRQLPPATLLIRKRNGHFFEETYWSPSFQPDHKMSLNSAAEEFQPIWNQAIKRHLTSDVPVGTFLSGGIDSSLVAANAIEILGSLKTFSIGFHEKSFDETPYALQASKLLGTDHEVIYFNESLESLIKELLNAYDQPFSDPALFPSLILARETSKKITVALTGDGGDELFSGYQRYLSTLISRKIAFLPKQLRSILSSSIQAGAKIFDTSSPIRTRMEAASRRISLIQDDISNEYLQQFKTFNDTQLKSILIDPRIISKPSLELDNDLDLLSSMLMHDLKNWLPDQMLTKTDRATMGYSLEARLPFLDKEVVDFALSIPANIHIRTGKMKRVLRAAASEILPNNLINRPKQGFSVPVNTWLRKEQDYVSSILDEGLKSSADVFNTSHVQKMWNEHRSEKTNHGERLLTILIYFSWLKSYD